MTPKKCPTCGAPPPVCYCYRHAPGATLAGVVIILALIGGALFLGGCATARPQPPVLIPDTSGPSPACMELLGLALPPGSTAEEVISAQHLTILAYEARIKACAIIPTAAAK